MAPFVQVKAWTSAYLKGVLLQTTQLEEWAVPLDRALSREHDTELSFPREEGCSEKWKMEDVLSDVRQMRQATKEAQSWLRTSKRLGPREGD